MNMQCTTLISPRKFVDLDPEQKDRYGLNKPRIHPYFEDSDVVKARDCVARCEEIIRAGGGEMIGKTAKNLTLTNIALSWRMSERLIEKFRRRDLR